MTREHLRFAVGMIIAGSAPILTGLIFYHELPNRAYEAAIVLATLAWQHLGTVIRSLFPATESGPPLGKDG